MMSNIRTEDLSHGQYLNKAQMKEMTRKGTAEAVLLKKQPQKNRDGAAHMGETAKESSTGGTHLGGFKQKKAYERSA